jgi:hypothetical protein
LKEIYFIYGGKRKMQTNNLKERPKKTLKRILALTLAVLLLTSVMPLGIVAQARTLGPNIIDLNGFDFTSDNDGGLPNWTYDQVSRTFTITEDNAQIVIQGTSDLESDGGLKFALAGSGIDINYIASVEGNHDTEPLITFTGTGDVAISGTDVKIDNKGAGGAITSSAAITITATAEITGAISATAGITVTGANSLSGAPIIAAGTTLTVEEDANLTIPAGTTLNNAGTINNHGAINNNDAITNTGTINNYGTIGTVTGGGTLNHAVRYNLVPTTTGGSVAITVGGTPADTGVALAANTTDVTLTATPADANWRVKEWTVNGATVAGTTPTTLELNNISALRDVTVEFERIPRTISFNANGGTGDMTAETVGSGLTYVIKANAFTRENHIFTGWSITSGTQTVEYQDEDTTGVITADITLYAQWDAKTVSIGSQTNTLTALTASAPPHATFTVTTANIVNGQSITGYSWYEEAAGTTPTTVPTGIIASATNVIGNSVTVTMEAENTAVAGTFYFKVTIDGVVSSNVGTLVVGMATPIVSWPTNLTAVFGNTLADINLPGDGTNDTPGTFSWTAATTTAVGDYGANVHNMTFTPTNTNDYNIVTNDVNVQVSRAQSVWVGHSPITVPYTLNASGTMTLADIALSAGYTWSDPTQAVDVPGGSYTAYYNVPGGNHNQVSGSIDVTVTRLDISSATVNLSAGPYTFDNTEKEPTVTSVVLGGVTVPSTGYSAPRYDNNILAGTNTATVTVEGTGNFTGEATATFSIGKATRGSPVTINRPILYTDDSGPPAFSIVTYSLGTYVHDSDASTRTFTAASSTTNNGIEFEITPQGMLSFKVATPPATAGQTASFTITVDDLTNYNAITVEVTIDITDKTIVEITGVTVTDKDFDSTAIVPGGTRAVKRQDNGNDVLSLQDSDFVYTYTGTGSTTYDSTTAPTAAGTYELVITIIPTHTMYTGTSDPISFTIRNATPSAPSAAPTEYSVNETEIVINTVSGQQYGISSTNNAANVSVWRDYTGATMAFDSLTPGATHYFFTRYAAVTNYNYSGPSPSLSVRTLLAPVITSTDNATAVFGTARTFNVIATGNPAPTFRLCGAEPAGVTINPTTGVISITGAVIADEHIFDIIAENSVTNYTQTFTLTVNLPPPPVINSANNRSVVSGTGGTFQVTATGAASYALVGAPAGVTINTSTGLITITGAVAAEGSPYVFTVRAINVGGTTEQAFTLTVTPAPVDEKPEGVIDDPGTITVIDGVEEIKFDAPFEDLVAARKNNAPLTLTPGTGGRILISGWVGYDGHIGEITSGSTTITLYEEFLKTLPNGKYTFAIDFTDSAGKVVTYMATYAIDIKNNENPLILSPSWKPAAATNIFNDVPNNSWQNTAVSWAQLNGITKVVGNTFNPDRATTRAEFVTFLHRVYGTPKGNAEPFSDIQNSIFRDSIIWAREVGVTVGVGGNRFRPNDEITREQIAAMLYRLLGDEKPAPVNVLDKYSDADKNSISPWAVDAVNWAAYNGLLGLNTDLRPGASATRAEAVTMIYRAVIIFGIDAP